MSEAADRSGVTARAVLAALAALIPLTVAGFYVEIAWLRDYAFYGVPSMPPVVVLVVLAAAGGLPVLRRVGFTRRELLTIYSILLVAGPLIGHGILFWMLPKVAAFYYLARAVPQWQTIFLPYLPTWFAPTDPAAVAGLFEGRASVPWSLWWTPLAAWCSFLLALSIGSTCLVAMLQRQWIYHERLSFPLAQIPLALVQDPSQNQPRRSGRLTRGGPLWTGVAVSLALSFLNSLSERVPSVPSVPLGPVPIVLWQKVGPLAGLGEIDLVLWPWLVALAFLIPGDLSFSCWFFWLVRVALTVAAITFGHEPQRPEEWFESGFPAPYNQAGGAALALGIWALWSARAHLSRVARIIFTRAGRAGDRAEPVPYRWAFVGFAMSFAWMVIFCWLAGCRFIFALVLVALIVNFYVVWARLRAETGLGFLYYPLEMNDAMAIFGGASLLPKEVVTLLSVRWAYYPGEGAALDVCTAAALEAFKIADASSISSRRLTAAISAGFLFSLVLGVFVMLSGLYRYGYYGLAYGRTYTWPAEQTRGDGERIVQLLTQPMPANIPMLIGLLTGAAVAVTLGALRLRLWWWPLHPLGYLVANGWGMHWWYMPFFVGWLSKLLVVRYGGLRLYRRAVPLAVGVIVGDLLNRGLWAAVAVATQGRF
jgi:hypothetical protein